MTAETGAAAPQTLESSVAGMDCAACARHVEQAITAVPGVHDAAVLLAAERASIRCDPVQASPEHLARAVANAGYAVRPAAARGEAAESTADRDGSLEHASQWFT